MAPTHQDLGTAARPLLSELWRLTLGTWDWGGLPNGPRGSSETPEGQASSGQLGRACFQVTVPIRTHRLCSEGSADQWVSLQPGLLEANPVGPPNPQDVV